MLIILLKTFQSRKKIEVKMYTAKITNTLTPTNWLYNLYVHSHIETASNLLSRSEIISVLDGGALILVLNLPNFLMITQIFIVCNHDQHDTSKTLTNANQSEVPIKKYVSLTCS